MDNMKRQPDKERVKSKRTLLGADDFVSFIHDWGYPEWVVLAVESPIEIVASAYSDLCPAKKWFRDVTVCPASDQNEEIAPLVAAVKVKNISWTVLLQTLCVPIDQNDFNLALATASRLSVELKSQVLAFIGENTSFAMGYYIYRNGIALGNKTWKSQLSSTRRAFGGLGLYIPACYPQRKGKALWLSLAGIPIDRIQRADLFDIAAS
jgi:hypothetical protein